MSQSNESKEYFENGYGLIIGAALNDTEEIFNRDANDIVKSLVNEKIPSYNLDRISILTTTGLHKPTKTEIISELDKFIEIAKENKEATFFIYYSGHGIIDGKFYFINSFIDKANQKYLQEHCISGEEFSEKINKINSDKVIIFLDCCYSGAAVVDLKKIFNSSISGKVVLASSRSSDVSFYDKELKNSLFTFYLLEALQGKCSKKEEREIHIFDLARFIENKINTNFIGNLKKQTTWLSYEGRTEFTVAFNPNFIEFQDGYNNFYLKDGSFNPDKIELHSPDRYELTILFDALSGKKEESFITVIQQNLRNSTLNKKVRRLYLKSTQIKIENEAKEEEAAQKIGELLKADIVVWGCYNEHKNEERVNLYIKIIKNDNNSFNQYLGNEFKKGELSSSSIKKMGDCALVDYYSNGITSISLFMIGLIHYNLENYQTAIAQFKSSLAYIEIAEQERKKINDGWIRRIKKTFQFKEVKEVIVFNKQIIHFYLGNCFYYLDNFIDSINHYAKSTHNNFNKNYLSFFNMGVIRLEEMFYKEAEEYFTQSKENLRGNKFPELYNNLGVLYYTDHSGEIKKIEQAKEYLNEAILLDDDFSFPYFNLGVISFNEERYHDAIQFFKKLFNSNDVIEPFLYLWLIYINSLPKGKYISKDDLKNLSKTLSGKIKLDQIRKYYKLYKSHSKGNFIILKNTKIKASIKKVLNQIENNPSDAANYLELGKLYLIIDNFNDAFTALNNALIFQDNDTDRVITLEEMGKAYYKKNDNLNAEKYFEKAIKILKSIYNNAPNKIKVAIMLGRNYENIGLLYEINNKKKAIRYYSKAIKVLESNLNNPSNSIDLGHALGKNYKNIGLLFEIDNKEKAIFYYQKAIKILELVFNASKDDFFVFSSLYDSYGHLALLSKDRNQDQFLEEVKKMLDFDEEVHKRNPHWLEIPESPK